MLSLLFSNPLTFIVVFGGIIIAIGIHEAAHCYMADFLGDPTPRSRGRLTLNPIAHLDPLGTLVLLVTGRFGWGKPSPYDPYNLANPKRDSALIALAGPASNILIAGLLSVILHLVPLSVYVSSALTSILAINVFLALFNLIPVPPLDGSKVVGVLMSAESAARYQSSTNPLLILLLILPIIGGASLAAILISPLANILLSFLIP
ncbi:MAG: site-2 protease family protein [bacterium]|nr:site-2 protease family protein [bacterium]